MYFQSTVAKRLDLLWKFLKPVSFALIGKEINFAVLNAKVVSYGALLVLLGSLVITKIFCCCITIYIVVTKKKWKKKINSIAQLQRVCNTYLDVRPGPSQPVRTFGATFRIKQNLQGHTMKFMNKRFMRGNIQALNVCCLNFKRSFKKLYKDI